MVLRAVIMSLVSALALFAQTAGERELNQALSNLETIRQQVEAGVAPRAKLDQAAEAVADARDAELLSRTLYGKDLTEEQSKDMESAALRRLDRRKATLDKLQTLVDAGALPVTALDGPRQEADWAKKEHELVVSRAELVSELANMARVEQQAIEAPEAGFSPVMERYDGDGSFTREDFKHVLLAFEKQFRKPLPISAQGETALHRALGFDHRDRVDVAISPDTDEGVWLREFLEADEIPYYAFRSSVPGKATAAHIHIGPPSNRIVRAD